MDALQIAEAYQDAIHEVRSLTYSHPLESQILRWTAWKLDDVMSYLEDQARAELDAAFRDEAMATQ